MVIDTSVLVAILWDQPQRSTLLALIRNAQVRLISAVSAYEASVVVFAKRKSTKDVADLWQLLHTLKVEVVPFGAEEAMRSAMAYQSYGKGVHPAGLNICDCPAYSLARARGLPLLFQGDDFAQTDIPTLR